jgi:hypothetical protein
LNIADIIIENQNFLREVDGAIGDGDYDVNMSKVSVFQK